VSFAVDWVSVVSGCHSRGMEASEALSRAVGLHGADRSYHALSLQVLFSAILNFSAGFLRRYSAFNRRDPDEFMVRLGARYQPLPHS
jgi:hypothetical protein